jgi:aspartate 1-decarboxylase
MIRAKIHQARITQCDVDYVGSITIDEDLLRAVDIRPNEAVSIYNIDNGNRFETYVFRGEPGSGIIGVNGAAARLVEPDQRIIIACYALMEAHEVDQHVARVIVVDDHNRIAKHLQYDSELHDPTVGGRVTV